MYLLSTLTENHVAVTASFNFFPPQVHSLYRTTGANFQKAQEEFAKGVVSNPGVQTATKQVASSAVSGAMSGAFTPAQN